MAHWLRIAGLVCVGRKEWKGNKLNNERGRKEKSKWIGKKKGGKERTREEKKGNQRMEGESKKEIEKERM